MTIIISETQIHDHLYRSRVLRKPLKVVKQDVAHTIAKLSEFYTHTSNQALPLYSDEANACEADVRERYRSLLKLHIQRDLTSTVTLSFCFAFSKGQLNKKDQHE